MNPRAETAPVTKPTIIEPNGWLIKSADAPIATPPANVELRTTSMSSFPLASLATQHADMTLVEIDNSVLINALYYWAPSACAPLKEGQYMKRKRVPIMAIRLLV
jgi:hypothetical protein